MVVWRNSNIINKIRNIQFKLLHGRLIIICIITFKYNQFLNYNRLDLFLYYKQFLARFVLLSSGNEGGGGFQ